MKYKYKITEGDQTTEKEGMSLKRLIKGLDPKKTFIVEYINKKGNSQNMVITNGIHSDYIFTDFNVIRYYRNDIVRDTKYKRNV